MKKNIYIKWIDDLDERENLSNSFQEYRSHIFPNIKVHCEFYKVKNKDLFSELNSLIAQIKINKKIDLFIIDHFLDKTKGQTIITKGSTVAQILREHFPNCAIIGISAAQKYKDIDANSLSLYDEFYSSSNFANHFSSILAIVRSYDYLKKRTINSDEDILKILKAPKSDYLKLKNIIPGDFKDKFSDHSFIFRLSRWIRFVLLMPGFLYDDLWAATHIGLNEEGFSIYNDRFVNAVFKGVFADPQEKRWWKSSIKEIVFNKFPNDKARYTWEVGRNLTREKKYYSKCYSCGEDFPEIVGFTDITQKNRVQLHIKCSEVVQLNESRLYFEDTRIMKG